MEERKRHMRAMRFQTDIPVLPSPTLPPVAKKKNKFVPITWDDEAAAARNTVIVGYSVELEKPYFRLTSVNTITIMQIVKVTNKTL